MLYAPKANTVMPRICRLTLSCHPVNTNPKTHKLIALTNALAADFIDNTVALFFESRCLFMKFQKQGSLKPLVKFSDSKNTIDA